MILTGNDLFSGRVVFWDGETWQADIQAAFVSQQPQIHAQLEEIGAASARDNVIVDWYLVEVKQEEEYSLAPIKLRDRWRIVQPVICARQKREADDVSI